MTLEKQRMRKLKLHCLQLLVIDSQEINKQSTAKTQKNPNIRRQLEDMRIQAHKKRR